MAVETIPGCGQRRAGLEFDVLRAAVLDGCGQAVLVSVGQDSFPSVAGKSQLFVHPWLFLRRRVCGHGWWEWRWGRLNNVSRGAGVRLGILNDMMREETNRSRAGRFSEVGHMHPSWGSFEPRTPFTFLVCKPAYTDRKPVALLRRGSPSLPREPVGRSSPQRSGGVAAETRTSDQLVVRRKCIVPVSS